jgi:multidrug efflux pump subunit AcrA (membrane-fusion protein)
MDMTRTINLADCLEFRQTLQARPPRIVHGTLLLLVLLVGAAVAWAALTKADLVVRAHGQVRPVSTPHRVANAVRSEVSSAAFGGRVVEVRVKPGDEVKQGDVLIRLDTDRLENEVAKRQQTILAGESDLAKEEALMELLERQFEAATAKSEAEMAQAKDEIQKAKDRRESEVRLATMDWRHAADDEAINHRLYRAGALAEVEMTRSILKTREAREKLTQASLPVDEGRPKVLAKAAGVAKKDFAVRKQESEMRREQKQTEVANARIELANLQLERKKAFLTAPVDGVVTRGEVKVGDTLEAGRPVIEIAEQKGFLFEIAVPSEDVAHLQVGLPARVKLDAYDHQKYGTLEGSVIYIAPDAEVREGHNVPTYLVRLRIGEELVGPTGDRGRVKFGMTGGVDIVTGDDTILMLLVKKVRRTISLG